MKKVDLYTDGACSGNPGVGGWCAILMYNGHSKVVSGYNKDTTNNRMEMLAVIKGIKAYPTLADLAQDKAKNEAILATFDKDYWTVIDGIPYWNALYVKDLKIVLRTNDNAIYNSTTVTENQTELKLTITVVC